LSGLPRTWQSSASAVPEPSRFYRACFSDFLRLAEGNPRTPLAISRFTPDLVRAYQYHLAERGLSATTIRIRLAVLASFSRWAVRSGKVPTNPVEPLVRPPKRATLPNTLRWEAVPELLDRCRTRRDRAILAPVAYGGLGRSEVVAVDIEDFDPGFGLRRVRGKGGQDAAVPLPKSARCIVSDYQSDRPGSARRMPDELAEAVSAFDAQGFPSPPYRPKRVRILAGNKTP
jgi:site-specific recombinase XerC